MLASVNRNLRINKAKRRRNPVFGPYVWFTRGSVLTIGYRLQGYGHVFTGLCMRVRHKSMLSHSTTFMVRNIFARISVELHVMLYGLCRLNFKFLDYARKKFHYRGAKLYYLRIKSNTASWVTE